MSGQNCSDYHKKCKGAPKSYKSSSLSRSFTLRKMKRVVIKQTLFAGRMYHISVCGRSNLGKIHIRVLNDDGKKSTLFDNATENFAGEKVFQVEATLPVLIELTAPHFFNDKQSECAGVSISYETL